MLTWLYDGQGRAAAFLDEFCIRSVEGEPTAWVFGLSVFSLRGEHIGWFENGVLFDVDNQILGFLAGATGVKPDFPVPAAAPPVPVLSKRPYVPTLRARPVRQASTGWSRHSLADYIDSAAAALPAPAFVPGGAERASHPDSPR